MSIENFVRAMPKVDLHVQLEGALQKELVLLIAEQADIARTYKRPKQFNDWVSLYQEPDFKRLDEIVHEAAAWVRHPDDLARVVYDLGLRYAKQQVKYAEVTVMPALFTEAGLTFQQFLDGINDGADRVERAWQVRIRWILGMARELPRKGDDIARWATSVSAQKGNVVAMSLVGREDAQPVAQFKKAFATAEKKELPRITQVYSYPDADSFEGVMEVVNPVRITDAWGLLDDEEAQAYVIENDIAVMMTPSREVRLGRIESLADYPFRQLFDTGVNMILGSGMPAMYESSLDDEYFAAVEYGGLTLDEIQNMTLNAVRASLLPEDDKQAMLEEFQQTIDDLAEEHLAGETE